MSAFEPTMPTAALETEAAEAIMGRSEPGHLVPPALEDEKEHSTRDHSTISTPDESGDVEKSAGPVSSGPPQRKTGVLWVLIVMSILSSTFLFALDNTIVADITPSIIKTFNSIDQLPWLSVAFLLGAASTNLVWGKIYAQFNAKWLYIGTVSIFEIGSLLCGAAPNISALIVGRALAGTGGVAMYIGVMTLLSVQTSEHERPAYIGLTGISWGVGTVIGPIIGGALAQSKVTWRFAFYLNLIIFAVCLPIYIFLIPSFTPRPGVPTKKRLQHIDFVGTTLIIGAFTCGTMAVSFGGITYPWSSGRVIALFILSALFFIGFGVQQYFCIFTNQYDRVFPVPFLKNYEMLVFYAQTSCMATALFVTIYFLPLYFQFTRGDTPLEAGVRLLPFIVFVVVFCIVNGIVLSKHGLYMPWYLGSGILVVIGAALMFTVDENTSTAKIYGYTILIGAGSGAAVQMGFSLAQAKVPPEEIPLAIGFITNGQVTGVVVALAVANSIFLNQSTNKISALLPGVPTHEIQSAIAGVGSDFFESLSSANKAAVIQIIVGSISKTYILAITAGALSVVLSLFLKREKLFLDGSAGAA